MLEGLVTVAITYFIMLGSVECFGIRSHKISTRNIMTMGGGGHGQGFKYLPVVQASRSEHFPRIVQIAGVYPNLTPEDLLAPSSTPAAPKGSWSYDFSDPSGPQLGTIAIPGSSVVTEAIDPVAIIAQSSSLGISMKEDIELVAVIDRADTRLVRDNFFVFRTPENTLTIQWRDDVPSGYKILGKVVLVMSPFLEWLAKSRTGFAEEDEDDD